MQGIGIQTEHKGLWKMRASTFKITALITGIGSLIFMSCTTAGGLDTSIEESKCAEIGFKKRPLILATVLSNL